MRRALLRLSAAPLARAKELLRAPGTAVGHEAEEVFAQLGKVSSTLQAAEVRDLLGACAAAREMPSPLWEGGLAAAVPTAAAALPPLPAVHVALLLSQLQLREPPEMLQEVAELLRTRASELPAEGLVGAVVALSQLGPWPQEPPPGREVLEALGGCLGSLAPAHLASAALAAATLGHVQNSIFWQQMHGALNAACAKLAPHSVADVLLALATHQLCPVTLLEELRSLLPRVAPEMQPDEALTAAWSLAALLFTRAGVLPVLLERALQGDIGPAEARQLRQIFLSLRLEEGAEEAFKMQAPRTFQRLSELAAESGPEEPEAAVEVAAENLAERLPEGVATIMLGEYVEDFYCLDLALQPSGEGARRIAVVLDAASAADAQAPHSPFTTLKCRHLRKLGWDVEWMPLRRWEIDEEARAELVERLLAASGRR